MEENNNQDYNNQNINDENQEQPKKEKHCIKKFIAILIAAFLGGFLAVYFVTDQIMERQFAKYASPFNHYRMAHKMHHDMEKMYEKDMKTFDNAFKNFDKNFEKNLKKMPKIKHSDMYIDDLFNDSVKIKTEFDDNNYNVIISLKPFQNDENKINYNVQGRKLTVFGKSEVKDKDYIQDISFSQDFILPQNADISKISKIKEDNKLIISVPAKN